MKGYKFNSGRYGTHIAISDFSSLYCDFPIANLDEKYGMLVPEHASTFKSVTCKECIKIVIDKIQLTNINYE